ncbi:right-handed parallel beta-helix repeat-containing protein [Paenibacillus lentus]|uniref:right-handed parallel beta-helix repeat-containing protein n=1 Tax=Paenibacillus lentus TaxID=1338368 RepID=UPI001FE9996B|nr:nitrous oxide reductase family maturation protein NosD [Paenibacillus lentus]
MVLFLVLTGVVLLNLALTNAVSTIYAESAAEIPGAASDLPSLQQLVDEASPGETLVLSEEKYAGPAVITKKLTIEGGKTAIIYNETPQAAIQIEASGVIVRGVNILQSTAGEETAAIAVHADSAVLEELRIKTVGFGILLRDSDATLIQNNEISWLRAAGEADTKLSQKGNGIDLYNSHQNRIEQNTIAGMRDGIYLENSNGQNVENNRLYGSRYGIHCMYVKDTRVHNNQGEFNVTGAMIMGVRNVQVTNNSFAKQSQNVNSQGILLFDVQHSAIERNLVEGNRVGIYIELSKDNQVIENSIIRNFIGIQFKQAEGNTIEANDFVSNVIEAEATDSRANEMRGNYWDSAQGLDMDNDGASDIPYAINPFYQELISKTPAFQLFFQSPGMTFLNEMYTEDEEHWATDSAPVMKLNGASAMLALPSGDVEARTVISDQTFMLIIATMLLVTAIITILYSGVSKT